MMVCYMRQRKSSKSMQNEERYKGRGYEHMDDTWNRADRR